MTEAGPDRPTHNPDFVPRYQHWYISDATLYVVHSHPPPPPAPIIMLRKKTHPDEEAPHYQSLHDEVGGSTSPSASSSSPWSYFESIPKRYIMCLLIFFSNILCYADRTNIGIAVLHMGLANSSDQGEVLAGFFYGYITTQFLGGMLANRYGGKAVLFTGVCIWVICDGLTVPAAASHMLWVLILARVGMGIGEGVNFPADHQLLSAWFVKQERTAFLTFTSSGVGQTRDTYILYRRRTEET